MSLPAVSINGFLRDFRDSDHVLYQWGAKPDLTLGWGAIQESDCSGWLSKMLIDRGYPQSMPRSSVEMRDYLLSQGFHRPDSLADVCKYAKHDGGRLFIFGFNLGGYHRHIGAVLAGRTMECASGLHGVGSRPATDFIDEVDGGNGWVVELPVVLS